jgi:TRIAP1/MDM35 family protein
LNEECPKFKEVYNKCFSKWYNEEFLKGQLNENPCEEEFEDFRACMLLSLNSTKLEIDVEKYQQQKK